VAVEVRVAVGVEVENNLIGLLQPERDPNRMDIAIRTMILFLRIMG